MWYGINAYFNVNRAIKKIFLFLKDKDPIQQISGVIYWFKCDRLDCNDEYAQESARTFVEMYKEHLKAPSSTNGRKSTTGHATTMDNFSMVGRGHGFARTFMETIYIRFSKPILNKNSGKYNLLHIGDGALISTQELQNQALVRISRTLTSAHNLTSTT